MGTSLRLPNNDNGMGLYVHIRTRRLYNFKLHKLISIYVHDCFILNYRCMEVNELRDLGFTYERLLSYAVKT